jgi:aldehyde dehydrogenase (NAD(P)+)
MNAVTVNSVTIPAPTPFPQLDAAVAKVKDNCAAFAKLPISDKVDLLRAMREGYHAIAEESVRQACLAKGVAFDSPVAGEEWLAGPMVTLRVLRLTEQALREVQQYGAPRISPKQLRTLPDGRLAVRVFPADGFDSVLLAKQVGEVYMQPGVTAGNLREHQASFYKKPHGGRVCLVLGAGNVNAIPPTDVIYKLFVEGTACVLKLNPVNAYLGPLMERAFASLISRGFLAIVYGGAEEGGYLVQHAGIDEVHITGSDKTHDAMVWGPAGPERDARKAAKNPLLKKDITSELGNITPVIVVPGPWDDASLEFQARNTAGMVCNNASFNCNSAKLLVTSRGWSQRPEFLNKVERHLGTGGVRTAWYPGAEQRWKQFVDGRKHVKLIGNAGPGQLSYGFITDVDRADAADRVFNQEPWCTVLSETPLDEADVGKFCAEATKFVNQHVWGTLAAMVLVHPETMRTDGAAVETMLRELRYGSVVVNSWAGAVFALGSTPWGGHPSATLEDIQSGRGWVHNTYMLEDLEKCVLRAPAKNFPVSPWFPGHRTADQLGRALTEFEYAPSWLKVPSVAFAAMRG